ncbi:HigA family addiction module antitoxin [Dyella jiangningensis]|uniref:Addiction module antidote protein, HigA family n=1 Tax=Dyella jiangningensis TaxID=1379159 RepID=A0A328P6Z4_9GAMM|nr:HigA family addiction module antitoxin [Dyella jiangningensis]RAO78058.1 addiction module antidote protein, HigA family [Dyella jiangningensis]
MYLIKIDPLMDFDSSELLRSPGEVLLTDYLQPNAMPLARFARRTGIPMTMLRQISLGARHIDAEQALRLSMALEPTAAYWLVLQARYDLALVSALWEGRRPPK